MLADGISSHLLHVALDHEFNKLLESRGLRIPAEFGTCLGRITPEVDHICRAVKIFADCHKCFANNILTGMELDSIGCGFTYSDFVDAFAFPTQSDSGMLECQRSELTYSMLHAGSDHEILRRLVLQYEPHALHIILGISPVAEAVEVAEQQLLLLALGNARGCQRDLAGNERLTAALRLMVEEDTRAAEHAVCFTVLLDNPVAVQFGYSIRAIRMERSVLILRHFLNLAVKLGCGGLVNLARLLQMVGAHRFQDTQNAYSIHISRELRCIEADLHMTLCGKVINLGRLNLTDKFDERHGVRHIRIMQMEMRLTFQMRNTLTEIN